MLSFLQRQNAVIPQPRRPSPNHYISMNHRHALGFVGSFQAAKKKCRGHSQGDGNNRRAVVCLVLVLMQEKPSTQFVTIDQASIWRETLKPSFNCRVLREAQKRGW